MRIIRLSFLTLASVCLLVAAIVTLRSPAVEKAPESITISKTDYDRLKLNAKLQLTNHRFNEALETARRAQTFRTDDHDVWGIITDALVELRDYPGAVQAAQRMIDLRPDSSSYARVSYLRELHGDSEGAIQAMTLALKAANPNDRDSAEWYREQLRLLHAGAKHPHTHRKH